MIKQSLGALALAVVLTTSLILPIEFGLDPTGIGAWLGILHSPVAGDPETPSTPPATVVMIKTPQGLTLTDLPMRESNDDPLELPDPSVYQEQGEPPKTRKFTVVLREGEQTEIKVIASHGAILLFDWQVASGSVYSDFHGHLPQADDIWVRYKEQDEAQRGAGSLIIPFDGEHGWYWLNLDESDITITLSISGYYDGFIDYGVSAML